MLTWLKEYGPALGAVTGVLLAMVAVLQIVVVGPMNRRFDQQDKYINARFDAVDQRIDQQDKRIDDLTAAMNQRFDQQDKYFNTRFDAQDERLDLLTNEVSELRKLTVSIIERVSRHEGQIDFLMKQLQTVDAPAP